jgi:hypothetical protein
LQIARVMHRLAASLLLVSACAAQDGGEPVAPNLLQAGKADDSMPLWAGLPSVTIERFASDPCNHGQRALGDAPVIYDDWARQRATIRNVCFEVWSPGITDWDNPDFWKQLDVQVHYRHGTTGAFQSAYVSSIDRRYNNRRYAWSLDRSLDPTLQVASAAAVKAPFEILSETDDWAQIAANLQFYFTVNGRALKSPSGEPFVVRYLGHVRKPTLAPNPNGYVLHDIVTCTSARFGSGAGFFAADIRDAAAVAALGAGTDGSWIYGVPTMQSGPLVSMTYLEQHPVAGEALPGFHDRGGLRIVPDGPTMRVEVEIYDRALGASRTVSATLAGCAWAAS